MAKKIYGEKTIERLKAEGYSDRAIEDITYISERHRARTGKVEDLLAQGYNPAQLDEIYSASRKENLPVNVVAEFYDRFRKVGKGLRQIISEVINSAEKGSLACHESYRRIPMLKDAIAYMILENDYGAVLNCLENFDRDEEGLPKRRKPRKDPQPQGEIDKVIRQEFMHQWGFV